MKKKIWPDNNKRLFNEPLDTSPLTRFIWALTLRMTLLFYHIDRANVSANRQILDLTLTLMWYWCMIRVEGWIPGFISSSDVFSLDKRRSVSHQSRKSAAESHLSPKNEGTLPSLLPPLRPTSHASPDYLFCPSRLSPPCFLPALFTPLLTCPVCHLWFRVSRFNWQAHFNNRYKPKKTPCVHLRGCAWLWPEIGSEQKKKRKKGMGVCDLMCVCLNSGSCY